MLTNKKKMIKVNMSWGGHIYVEPYHCGDNEEENRSKIYDEKGYYLSYIDTEFTTLGQFKEMLKNYKNSKSLENFVKNYLCINSWDYGTDLNNLLYSIYEDTDNDTFEQLETDIATLNEEQLMSEYCINKIGKWYFYLDY